MTPRLDRELQGRILNALAEVYPDQIELDETLPDVDPHLLAMNLHYLCEHGLAETKWSQLVSGPPIPGAVRITARGMDFLADDGGLSEVLGVVTVKLHQDTVQALLIDRINASDEPASVKARLIDQAKCLPAEAMKTLTLEAMKAGLSHWPNVLTFLQNAPGN